MEGIYERDLQKIRHHYLSKWFLPDLISAVPIDALFLATYGMHTSSLLRLTRLLRLVKLGTYFKVWEQYSTRYPYVIRFFKLMLGLVMIFHYLCCVWVYCGYERGFGSSAWLPTVDFSQSDLGSQYVQGMWWSTNIVTTIGGDPGLPSNDFERVMDLTIAFLSVFVVATIIGHVSELVSEMSAEEGRLRRRLDALNRFMYTRRLPDDLQDRIRSYYFNLWSRRGGVGNDTRILSDLPSALKTEVSLVMNKDILGKVPLFQSSSQGFINSLVQLLKNQSYSPKDMIVKQGDIGSEMYFISRGEVAVLFNDEITGLMSEGGFFGEIAVLQERAQRTRSIQAINYVDLFVLTHDDLQMMFRSFPHEKQIIMRVADTRKGKDLLRKELNDSQIFAREQVKGFGDPEFVSLLADLFYPLEQLRRRRKTHSNAFSPSVINALAGQQKQADGSESKTPSGTTAAVGDDDGEDEDIDEGFLFDPSMPANTVYFVGKGCVDIVAPNFNDNHVFQVRRESLIAGIAEEDRVKFVDEDGHELSYEDMFQHVIRISEGQFFGQISQENYNICASIPFEYRQEAIIFALDVDRLSEIDLYFASIHDTKLRVRLKKGLATLLTRHEIADDYRRLLLPPPPPKEHEKKERKNALLKSVARTLITNHRKSMEDDQSKLSAEAKEAIKAVALAGMSVESPKEQDKVVPPPVTTATAGPSLSADAVVPAAAEKNEVEKDQSQGTLVPPVLTLPRKKSLDDASKAKLVPILTKVIRAKKRRKEMMKELTSLRARLRAQKDEEEKEAQADAANEKTFDEAIQVRKPSVFERPVAPPIPNANPNIANTATPPVTATQSRPTINLAAATDRNRTMSTIQSPSSQSAQLQLPQRRHVSVSLQRSRGSVDAGRGFPNTITVLSPSGSASSFSVNANLPQSPSDRVARAAAAAAALSSVPNLDQLSTPTPGTANEAEEKSLLPATTSPPFAALPPRPLSPSAHAAPTSPSAASGSSVVASTASSAESLSGPSAVVTQSSQAPSTSFLAPSSGGNSPVLSSPVSPRSPLDAPNQTQVQRNAPTQPESAVSAQPKTSPSPTHSLPASAFALAAAAASGDAMSVMRTVASPRSEVSIYRLSVSSPRMHNLPQQSPSPLITSPRTDLDVNSTDYSSASADGTHSGRASMIVSPVAQPQTPTGSSLLLRSQSHRGTLLRPADDSQIRQRTSIVQQHKLKFEAAAAAAAAAATADGSATGSGTGETPRPGMSRVVSLEATKAARHARRNSVAPFSFLGNLPVLANVTPPASPQVLTQQIQPMHTPFSGPLVSPPQSPMPQGGGAAGAPNTSERDRILAARQALTMANAATAANAAASIGTTPTPPLVFGTNAAFGAGSGPSSAHSPMIGGTPGPVRRTSLNAGKGAAFIPHTMSMTPTLAPHLHHQTPSSRKMDFLEKALGALTSDELMLLVQRATTQLYSRLLHTSVQQDKLQAELEMHAKKRLR